MRKNAIWVGYRYGIETVSIDQGEEEEIEVEKENNIIYKNDEEDENRKELQSDTGITPENQNEIKSSAEHQTELHQQHNINQKNNAVEFYEKNISKSSIAAHILSQLQTAINEFGEELVMFALQRTVENTAAPNWQYAKAILSSWKEKGIMTTKQAVDERKNKNINSSTTSNCTSYKQNTEACNHRKSNNKFMNFKQTPYDWEEIEQMELERTLKAIEEIAT